MAATARAALAGAELTLNSRGSDDVGECISQDVQLGSATCDFLRDSPTPVDTTADDRWQEPVIEDSEEPETVDDEVTQESARARASPLQHLRVATKASLT